MNSKRIVPRPQAEYDVETAVDRYLHDAGVEVALGFVDAIEVVYQLIAEHPLIGSPRYAHELNLPRLRHRRLTRFPWLVFYVERDDYVDVWRVLDARSELAEQLADPDEATG